MQLIKFLPLLATLVPLVSAIQFTIPEGRVIHTCPFPAQTNVTWDFVSTDPDKANLYESCKDGDSSGLKLISMDVNVKAGGVLVVNSDLDKPISPFTKCSFRLVSPESNEILAEQEIDVVCSLSNVSLTFRSTVAGHERSGYFKFHGCLLDACVLGS
jgi:hypothetical protein